MVISVINQDDEIYQKFKLYCFTMGKSVTETLWNHVVERVKEYEMDNGNRIETYLDPNFIPKPVFDAEFNEGLKWIRTQNDEKLNLLRDQFYRFHIITKAIIDCQDRKNFSMDYVAAWKRYK